MHEPNRPLSQVKIKYSVAHWEGHADSVQTDYITRFSTILSSILHIRPEFIT